MIRLRLRSFLVALSVLAVPAAAAAADDGVVGPAVRTTGNGRVLAPAGRLTALGNFPTGAALSPDGRFLWAVDSGHGADDVKVVDLATHQVVQTLPLPGGYAGVAFAPDGRHAYVSGEAASDADPAPPAAGPLLGGQGDVVHVYEVDPATGAATERPPMVLPGTSGGSGQLNSLPPTSKSWPEGLAVTPDGKTLVVALNQADRVAILDATTGQGSTVQVGRYPNAVAITPDGKTALVSNELDGTVSFVDIASGAQAATVAVGGQLGDFGAHPEGIVVDAARGRAYVGVASRDRVAAIDLKARKVVDSVSVARSAGLGTQPVGLALSRDDGTLYAADEGEDAVAVIDLAGLPSPAVGAQALRRPRSVVRVRSAGFIGRHGARPGRLVRACGGPTRRSEKRYLAAARRALAVRRRALRHARTRTARRSVRQRFLRVTRRAARRLAPVVRCRRADTRATHPMRLVGKVPTAAFPMAVAVAPSGALAWVAAKGFGAGPNPGFVFDGSKSASGNVKTPYGQYVPDLLDGVLGTLPAPSARRLADLSARADRQVLPANRTAPPAGTPLRAGGPIKHVFYVVRENRTYDQIFGSDPRGAGDPQLELFDDNGVSGPTGGITPNAHALTRRFPLLDHVYADSEVSVDGHIITAGSIAIDYVQRGLHANYSGRGRSYDFGVFPVTFGPRQFVFDQAVRDNVSFRNYGEQGGGELPTGSEQRPTYQGVAQNSDFAYPGPAQIGCLSPPADGPTCFRDSSATQTGTTPVPAFSATSRMDLFAAQFKAQDSAGSVPAFNYVILPNDHTNGTTPQDPTPQAEIADNDLGLGQLVDTISHSSVWRSSAIIVVEDDSQDGADHIDAHRMPAFVISPWAKTGVVPTRYDQYSALRTAEILAGLRPLSINDGLATPMYDAFRTDGKPDTAPYDAIVPAYPLTAVNGASAPAAALSRALPFGRLDAVPQAISDQILWRAVHGERSTPPSPGPDASPDEHDRAVTALRLLRESPRAARRYLLRSAGNDGG